MAEEGGGAPQPPSAAEGLIAAAADSLLGIYREAPTAAPTTTSNAAAEDLVQKARGSCVGSLPSAPRLIRRSCIPSRRFWSRKSSGPALNFWISRLQLAFERIE